MPSKRGKTISDREIRKGSMTTIPGMLWESFEFLQEIFTLGISLYRGASPSDLKGTNDTNPYTGHVKIRGPSILPSYRLYPSAS
jgi:hypothetical protein